MDLVIEQAFKILGMHQTQSKHIDQNKLLQKLNKKVKIPFNKKKFMKKLATYEFITINNPDSENPTIKIDSLQQQFYAGSNVLNIYFPGKDNKNARDCYHAVNRNENKDMTYQQIAQEVIKGNSGSNTKISHQCRRLAKFRFLKIEKQFNSSEHTNSIISQCTVKLSGHKLQLKPEKSKNDLNSSNLSKSILQPQEGDTTNTNPDIVKMQPYIIENEKLTSEQQDYILKESFFIRELNFQDNFLLNCASFEAQQKEGLLLVDFLKRLNKSNQKKMIARFIDKSMNFYNVQQIPERNGKTYSWRYLIRKKYDTEELGQDQNNHQVNNKTNGNSVQQNQQRKTIQDFSMVKQEQIESNIKEEQQQLYNQKFNFSIQQQQVNQYKPLQINKEAFIFFIEFFKGNEQYLKYLNQNLNKTQLEKLFSFQRKDDIQIIYQQQQEEQEEEENKIQISQQEYEEFTYFMVKVIAENLEFEKDDANKEKKTNRVSKRQLSKLKLNRYVFTINEVFNQEVTDTLVLRKNLLDFEADLKIGTLDRRTMDRMIDTLEIAKLFKTEKKEFSVDYFQLNKNFTRRVVYKYNIKNEQEQIQDYCEKMEHGLTIKKEEDDMIFQDNSDSEFQMDYTSKSLRVTRGQLKKSQVKKEEDVKIPQKVLEKIFKKRQEKQTSQYRQNLSHQQKKQSQQQQIDKEVIFDESNLLEEEEEEEEENNDYDDITNLTEKQRKSIITQALARAQSVNSIIAKVKYFEFWMNKFQKKVENRLKKESLFLLKPDFSQIFTKETFWPKNQSKVLNNQQIQLKQDLYELKYVDYFGSDFYHDSELQQNIFTQEQIQHQNHNKTLKLQDIYDDIYKNFDFQSTNTQTQNMSQSTQEDSEEQIAAKDVQEFQEKCKQVFSRNDISSKTAIQSAAIKIKTFFVRNPTRSLLNLKLRFPQLDMFNLITCLTNDGSMYITYKNQQMEINELKDIMQNNNLDQIYYNITEHYLETYFT